MSIINLNFKKILLCTLVLCFITLFAFAEDVVEIKIDDKWIESISTKRDAFTENAEIYDLVEFDYETLDYLSRSQFLFGDYESSVATLVHKMIIENKKYNDKNVILGLDILTNKFRDKKYLVNFGFDLINSERINNYQIVVKIIDGYAKVLNEETCRTIFSSVGFLSPKLNRYIYNQYENGSQLVISSFMGFLVKYMELVDLGQLPDNYRGKIMEYCDKLQLNETNKERKNEFENIKNFEELNQAFFFYKTAY